MNHEHYHDPTAEKGICSHWTVTKIVPDYHTERRDSRMREKIAGKEERRRKAEYQRKEKIKRQNLLLHEKVLMLEKMKVNLAKLEQTLDEYTGIIDPAEARQRKQLKANACEFISRYKIKVSDILTKNGGL